MLSRQSALMNSIDWIAVDCLRQIRETTHATSDCTDSSVLTGPIALLAHSALLFPLYCGRVLSFPNSRRFLVVLTSTNFTENSRFLASSAKSPQDYVKRFVCLDSYTRHTVHHLFMFEIIVARPCPEGKGQQIIQQYSTNFFAIKFFFCPVSNSVIIPLGRLFLRSTNLQYGFKCSNIANSERS